jgi:hypothetical protein
MFDSFRVTREQALNYSELVRVKRAGVPGAGAILRSKPKVGGNAVVGDGAKVAGDAAVGDEAKVTGGTSKSWRQKAKNFLLSLVVGVVAANAGTDMYRHMNPNSPALGGTGEPRPTNAPAVIHTPPNTGSTTPSSPTSLSPGYTTAGSTTPGYYTTTTGGYSQGSTTTSESSIPSHV